MFAGFPDFAFYRVEIESAHLVAGFGRIVDLTPQDILTDISGAEDLLAAEEGAVAHMNEDHAEAVRLYATRLLGAADGAWVCAGLDPDGMELQHGRQALRLPFPRRVTGGGPLRAVLKELAENARARV
jgi:putative heme iron utilization protein